MAGVVRATICNVNVPNARDPLFLPWLVEEEGRGTMVLAAGTAVLMAKPWMENLIRGSFQVPQEDVKLALVLKIMQTKPAK